MKIKYRLKEFVFGMNYYSILLRLGVAILIGGLLGYEREYKNRPAGLRTHILVCVGAAVISMIQMKIIDDTAKTILLHPEMAAALKADMGRLGAQVISGIGFLGVGTIIHDKGSVKGLTTAASIWVTACIGLAIGMGYYFLSFASAIGVLVVVVCMKNFESSFFGRIKAVKLDIEYHNKGDLNVELNRYFKAKNIKVKDEVFIIEKGLISTPFRKCSYTILVSKYANLPKIEEDLNKIEQIVKAKIIQN